MSQSGGKNQIKSVSGFEAKWLRQITTWQWSRQRKLIRPLTGSRTSQHADGSTRFAFANILLLTRRILWWTAFQPKRTGPKGKKLLKWKEKAFAASNL